MTDLIALITIMTWPVVPLFWIPVHGFPKLFRRIGLFTYIVPVLTWLPIAYLIYTQRSFLLSYKIGLPTLVIATGIFIFLAGSLLQFWTLKLLRLSGLMGMPEISKRQIGRFVAEGPFLVVRHPTYLSHTMMFLGVFLITGVVAVAISTIIDLVAVNLLVIPLEERELASRFSEEYRQYRNRVPRYFPKTKFR